MTPPDHIIVPFKHWCPFRVIKLPIIGTLYKLVYQRYTRRWTKRIFKKPIRWIFEFCYRVLRLSGSGHMILSLPNGEVGITFDARKAHFSTIYLSQYAMFGYEPDVAGVLNWLLYNKKNSTFYDIGANWGFFSFYAASLEFFAGQIHVFEPIHDTFSDIESIALQTGLDNRLVLHQVALSDTAGATGMAAIDPLSSGVNRILNGATDFLVDAVTLDELNLPQPDVMKIDVEEHEFQMLQGAMHILTTCNPHIIFENWKHIDHIHSLKPLRMLESIGYTLYQPCWYNGEWKIGFLDSDLSARLNLSAQRLCLSRLRAEDRFLFKDHMNLVAIHNNRLQTLLDAAEVVS